MNDASKASVTIKKYANRRLYNTATSSYVTLETLAGMVKEGIEFNVYDAKTSEDITQSVLRQIVVEEEEKVGQPNLLPVNFLRQLIGLYGNNMQWLVPKYLEHSMETLSNNQEQITNYFQTTFGTMFPFGMAFGEMSKQNLALFEKALRMFVPFVPSADKGAEDAPVACETSACACASESCKAPCAEEAAPALSRRPEPVIVPVTAEEPPAELVSAIPATSTPPMSSPLSAVPAPAAVPTADDMQQKIANLQRQLADLAKNRA
jgi:polyhydroxyalkanoate synthesis repressor PhaR